MLSENSSLALKSNLVGGCTLPSREKAALPYDIQEAFRFFQRPDVQVLLLDLQRSVFNFILAAPDPLEAIDNQTEKGTFVYEGIRELLMSCQTDDNLPLTLNRWGNVELTAQGRLLGVGVVFISLDSPMLEKEFVCRPVQGGKKSVFQLQQVSSWVPVSSVMDGHASGFVLNDQQCLAAEIAMTMDYLLTYAQIADTIATNEQDAGETILRMKVGANLSDCLGAARYCRDLEERLISLKRRIDLDMRWRKLSGPLGGYS